MSTAPGFLVNLIPGCEFSSRCFDLVTEFTNLSLLVAKIPEWFPGAGFRKTAKEWAKTLNEMVDQPFNLVKSQVVSWGLAISGIVCH